MPSLITVETMVGDFRDGKFDPLHYSLSRIELLIQEMQKCVDDMMGLEYRKNLIKRNTGVFSLMIYLLVFHNQLMEFVGNLHREWARNYPQGKKLNALIVDSNTAYRLLYRSVLSRPPSNMEIDEVSSGEDAIKAHAGRGDRYHLIIMNRELYGIGGTMTARKLLHEMGVKFVVLGIQVIGYTENYLILEDSSEEVELKNSGISHFLLMDKFSGSHIIMVLGTLASKEMVDHVEGEVQKVIDIVNDIESTLGIKSEPADDHLIGDSDT